jgi:hypothetical protein
MRAFPTKSTADWRLEFATGQTHAVLTLQIRDALTLRGWYVLVTPRGGIPGQPGFPDLVAFKARRVLFLEVKVGRDKLKFGQVVCGEELRARGFEVVEVRTLGQALEAAA